MKKELIAAAVLGFGSSVLFGGAAVDAMTTDPNVLMTSLKAQQRYPWNGKVDIDFSFACDIPEAFAFVNFKASYEDKDGNTVEVPMKTFDQFTTAFCTNAGTYRVTWDSTADAPNLLVTNLKYSVTANMAKYMVIDLSKGLNATAEDPYPITYMEECPDPTRDDGGWTDEYKTTKMVFRLIQPQTYVRGWGNNSFGDYHDCYNGNQKLTRPFYMAIFECTQGQAKRIHSGYSSSGVEQYQYTGGSRADARPSAVFSYENWRGNSATHCWPNTAGTVSSGSIIGQLRSRTGQADYEGFDLPTEAEWECAARAGDTGAWHGDGLEHTGKPTTGEYTSTSTPSNTLLNTLGRYKYNGGYAPGASKAPDYSSDESLGTAVVGSYRPNAWGLYDVLGNVWEFCLDYYKSASPYNVTHDVDDMGRVVPDATTRPVRVVRGGAFDSDAKTASLAKRGNASCEDWAVNKGVRLCWHFPYAPKSE